MVTTLPAPRKLPYFRQDIKLPGPLPTVAEIRDAPDEGLSPRKSGQGNKSGVRLIRNKYVVKWGSNVTENEGNALLFIEEHLTIPAPRLCAMYRDPASECLYLVTEYIAGINLETLWRYLSTEGKLSIANQLETAFTQMRSLSPPNEVVGSACGGPVPDPVFRTESPNSMINGPFKNSMEASEALALASKDLSEQANQSGWIPGFFTRHLSAALGGHGVKFTHADLHMRHILVKKNSRDGDSEGVSHEYRITGIVDWEYAGWYPAYWDYVSAISRFQSERDWPETVDRILKPCTPWSSRCSC